MYRLTYVFYFIFVIFFLFFFFFFNDTATTEIYTLSLHDALPILAAPGIFIGLTLGLIFLEPDWGTTLLLAAVSGLMLLIAGVRWRCFFPPLLAGAATFAPCLLHNPTRLNRVVSWLNPEATKEGVGYQAWQAMLALGSGGWTGLGLGNGRQKFGYLPEHQTDFIFANIGEELGLIATL